MSKRIEEIINKFESNREELIPILHAINDQEGYISRSAMQLVANYLDINPADVYGTTTFYSFFNTKEKGANVIRVCQSISCDLADKSKIVATLEEACGIQFGETTKDKKITLEYTNCIGMCDFAPAMLINYDVYTNLTPEKIKTIISKLKKEG